ncbi:MAG: PIN domain-containing protein [Deltaproteobacteria bacterium]|nr:PIN domain-containing protein [Deltaproteobacteria bacterium]
MTIDRLPNLPAGTDLFLDANVFIYAFGGRSNECHNLLQRCSTEEVFGITTFEVIHEVTHRLMLIEAVATGVITKESVAALKGKWRDVTTLTQYWSLTARIFGLNILILASEEPRLHRAHTMRSRYGLLTNDSLILAAMDEYGIGYLATRDDDFDHISELTVYKPTDI